MNTIRKDVRFAFRSMLKNLSVSSVVILTLALGIGANAAIFCAVNSMLFHPLGFRDTSRIVSLSSTLAYFPAFSLGESPADYADIKRETHTFEQMAIYQTARMNLLGHGDPEEVSVAEISASLLPLLGIRARYGNVFSPRDERDGTNVAVLADTLWQKRFGSNPNAIGKTILLNGNVYTIVGIMPRRFGFPENSELWIPISPSMNDDRNRMNHSFSVLATLKSGVTLSQASAEMSAIASRLAMEYPTPDQGLNLHAVYLDEETVKEVKPALLLLWGAAGFVLLIACGNVDNLLLATALKREREFAIRTALGASRFRIILQLLVEYLLLTLAGGAGGLLFALWGIYLIRSFAPSSFPNIHDLHMDLSVVFFALIISIVTGILIGMVPALKYSRANLSGSLKEAATTFTESGRQRRWRDGLVICEIGLTTILLVASALAVKSLIRLTNTNVGLRTENILTVRMRLSESKYPTRASQINFLAQLLEKLDGLPNVENTAVSDAPLLGGSITETTFTIDNSRSNSIENRAEVQSVSPKFFESMGGLILAGRDFAENDAQRALPAVIINEVMSRKYWTDRSPIGQRLSVGKDANGQPKWLTIVGITRNTRNVALDLPPAPQIFLPFFQTGGETINLFVRTKSEPSAAAVLVRNQVWSLDKDQPVTHILTSRELISESVSEPRFRTVLLSLFTGLGLMLAVSGIYSVISYSVSQRRPEIAIRMTFGANSGDIQRMVLNQAIRWVLAGIIIGLIGAIAIARLMSSLLFDVTPFDPTVLGAVAGLLLSVGLLACYVPARRATRVHPMDILRSQ
jgi:putative ABC transport system permease protein